MTGFIQLVIGLLQGISYGGVTIWTMIMVAIWLPAVGVIVWFFIKRLSQ